MCPAGFSFIFYIMVAQQTLTLFVRVQKFYGYLLRPKIASNLRNKLMKLR